MTGYAWIDCAARAHSNSACGCQVVEGLVTGAAFHFVGLDLGNPDGWTSLACKEPIPQQLGL